MELLNEQEFLPSHLRVSVSACSDFVSSADESPRKESSYGRPSLRLRSWEWEQQEAPSPSRSYSEAVGSPFGSCRPLLINSPLGASRPGRAAGAAAPAVCTRTQGCHLPLSAEPAQASGRQPPILSGLLSVSAVRCGPASSDTKGTTFPSLAKAQPSSAAASGPALTPPSYCIPPPLPVGPYPADMGSAKHVSPSMRPPWQGAPPTPAPQPCQDTSPTSQQPVSECFRMPTQGLPYHADASARSTVVAAAVPSSTPHAHPPSHAFAPCGTPFSTTAKVITTASAVPPPAPPRPCPSTGSFAHQAASESEADSVVTVPLVAHQLHQSVSKAAAATPRVGSAAAAAAGPSSSSGMTSVEDSLSDEEGDQMGAGSNGKCTRVAGAKKIAPDGTRMACTNCGATQTPQWRCGPKGPRTLCNRCGVAYKKGRPLESIAPVAPERLPGSLPTQTGSKHTVSAPGPMSKKARL